MIPAKASSSVTPVVEFAEGDIEAADTEEAIDTGPNPVGPLKTSKRAVYPPSVTLGWIGPSDILSGLASVGIIEEIAERTGSLSLAYLLSSSLPLYLLSSRLFLYRI